MFNNFFQRLYDQFIAGDGFSRLLEGLKNTMLIALFGLIIGVVLGVLLAIMRVIPGNTVFGKICNTVSKIYITVIRGIPLVVLLLLGYYGIFGPMGASALVVGIAIFGINSGAYVAEIVRSGIQAVDKGQMEAGRSLGLSYSTTMLKIILPQAVKNILPALGNEFIVLIKETSVAGFITVFDLTRAGREIVSKTYDAFVPYIVLAAVYLVLVLAATYLVGLLERRLSKSDNR
ncbi:amino acid ABC transporter permease [Eubacteriales bacterium OttesenSCG-928-G02]|nr:amino acid ABC transporter permease [Eubacteriales bacterium OttesenSCG-928-G02]